MTVRAARPQEERARARRLFYGAATAACLLAPSAARAGSCTQAAGASPCINDDAAWPHAGPTPFLFVGGTETVTTGHLGFGLHTSYLSRSIVYHLPSPGPSGSDQYAIDDQVNASFLWALGITNRLELDVVLPVTLAQGGSGLAPLTGTSARLQDTAMRDLRFGVAYALVPRTRVDPRFEGASRGSLTGRLEFSAPTSDRDQFAGDRGGVVMPSLAADYRRGRWFAGVEVGARIRQATTFLGAQMGTQLVGALGLGVDVLDRELLALAIEAQALPTLAPQRDSAGNARGALVPAEWALSARTAPLLGGDLGLQLGGGGGFGDALTEPRFRFTLAVRYAPLARDTDGDGIPDDVDRCPREAGPHPTGCLVAPPSEGSRACESGPPLIGVDSALPRCSDAPSLTPATTNAPPAPAGPSPMPVPSSPKAPSPTSPSPTSPAPAAPAPRSNEGVQP